MPRPERFLPAGVPVHVTQRGNFRQPVFAREFDYSLFAELLGRYAREYENRIVAYCLMPNHFHLVAVPGHGEGLSAMMQTLNSKYARLLNERLERLGHVWQTRFWAATMSQQHYRTALAYVDLNPVRAGLVRDAREYAWSSAGAHAGVVAGPAFLDREEFARMYSAEDWAEILQSEQRQEDLAALRRATKIGAVAGEPEFVEEMERKYGRVLRAKPRGRPKKVKD